LQGIDFYNHFIATSFGARYYVYVMKKFAFSEAKAVEALAFIANESPGLSPFYVSKTFFFAEKWHINRFGRPIIADTYIAMINGPVPSTVKNYLDEDWKWAMEPEGFREAVAIRFQGGLRRLMPGTRKPNLGVLSETDMACLREAIAFCGSKTMRELSDLTHFDKSWQNAGTNGPMDYADFVDDNNPHRDAVMARLEESAACGVL
jgi:Protein of unknown function (DUF4065)